MKKRMRSEILIIWFTCIEHVNFFCSKASRNLLLLKSWEDVLSGGIRGVAFGGGRWATAEGCRRGWEVKFL